MQMTDDLPAFRPNLVGERDEPGQRSVNGNVNAGIALLVQIRAIGLGGVNVDAALLHETLITDVQIITVHLAFNAKADPVFGFFAIRNIRTHLMGFLTQRMSDRMLELGFRSRCQSQQVTVGNAALVADDVDHLRRTMSERAGFVENDSVDLGKLSPYARRS